MKSYPLNRACGFCIVVALGWMFVSSQNFLCSNCNAQCDGISGPWEVMGHEDGDLLSEINALGEKPQRAPLPCPHSEHTVQRHHL